MDGWRWEGVLDNLEVIVIEKGPGIVLVPFRL
jgi:hypothetical protein